LRTANSFHVRGDDKHTRSVQCIVFKMYGGRIPSIREMNTDEYGLRSMKDIDPVDLRMSSQMWEKKGLLPMGKSIERTSLYGANFFDDENAESMMKMFVGLPAEVITQGVSRIHEEFSKFFCAEYYFEATLKEKDSPLAPLNGNQKCFVIIQNRCVQATEELSRLVTEAASQRPVTLMDFWTQELAIEMQTRLWELSKFQPIGSLQEEIAKKYCRFQIRDEGARLNSATKNAIGNALALLLDTIHGDRDDASKSTIKEVFAICREKFCSMNGAPIGRLVDENLRKERAMLARAETKTKVPFANRNGKPDKSDVLDPQFAKLKK
jgi:hypothetical protein